MKARRHQPRADKDDAEAQLSSNEVRYGEKGPVWFPVALGALFLLMVGALLCLTPQSRQHAWLSLHERPAPPPTPVVATEPVEEPRARATEPRARASVPLSEKDRYDAFEGANKYLQRPLQQVPGLPPGPEVKGGEADKRQTTRVKCATTAGPLLIDIYEGWAPLGAQRFLDMVRTGFFSSRVGLFRAVKNFLCQTGVPGDPSLHQQWRQKGRIKDDPQWLNLQGQKQPLKRGYLAFAGGGRDSRTTEFFFAFRDLKLGFQPWEVPFGTLVGEGSFAALDRFYAGYGDMGAFGGHAPAPGQIYKRGAAYLDAEFPLLDFITSCDVDASDADDDAARTHHTAWPGVRGQDASSAINAQLHHARFPGRVG